jgi:hypothetical protein
MSRSRRWGLPTIRPLHRAVWRHPAPRPAGVSRRCWAERLAGAVADPARDDFRPSGPGPLVRQAPGGSSCSRSCIRSRGPPRIAEPSRSRATAPSQLTFIRGGFDIVTHDVLSASACACERFPATDFDAISSRGHDVIVDHRSLTGDRREPFSCRDLPAALRTNGQGHVPPHHVQQQHHCRLANATHAKGEHSGLADHDNCRDVITQPLRTQLRAQPLFKGGAWVESE